MGLGIPGREDTGQEHGAAWCREKTACGWTLGTNDESRGGPGVGFICHYKEAGLHPDNGGESVNERF